MISRFIIIAVILTCCFSCINRKITEGSEVLSKLLEMDFHKYKLKEGTVFFEDLKYKYRKSLPLMRKPGYIDRVMFVFTDNITIEMRVFDLGQKNRLNDGYKFDEATFLSKKIEWIRLKKDGECLKGCEGINCN